MNKCKCGSYAINLHKHGRDGSESELCDVCFWRKRADVLREALANVLNTSSDMATKHSDTLHLLARGAATAALAATEPNP